MQPLVLKNTLTNKKETFSPQENNSVSMYVCGVTPYDDAHIGHGRCYVTFDVLYRLLSQLGYDVQYCRNFTDIDDKLINRAKKEHGDYRKFRDIASKYIASYTQDMERLNCKQPTCEPRVTDTIPEIIAFVQKLIDRGFAYESEGDVYFDVQAFADYGKLSKRDINDLRAGARVEINTKKKNPLDFALWKHEPTDTYWDSPWGNGRPGWHIECSVMANKHLGETIDIHGGGMDLIFPHHENEVAQSQAASGKNFARYWVHNAFVRINKEKMSKSLGNFFTLKEIFEKFDPMVVRYMFLTHHYRSPLDFSFEELENAQKGYKRLANLFADTKKQDKLDTNNPLIQKMLAFLLDDLNSTGMFGIVFENFKHLQENETNRAAVKTLLQDVLGLSLEKLPEKELEITPQIEKLVKEREQARAAKDWAKADAIRDQLNKLGYTAQDKKIN